MGDKFGKSSGNAVWLSSRKSSPFTLYQFLVRSTDVDVEKFLKLFTFDTVGSVDDLMRRHKEKPELHLAQKRLAEQVTLLVHGGEYFKLLKKKTNNKLRLFFLEKGLKTALLASSALYDGNIESLGQIPAPDLVPLLNNATTVELLPEAGMTILELAMKAKCFPTQSMYLL